MNAVSIGVLSSQSTGSSAARSVDASSSRVTEVARPVLSAAKIQCSFHCDKLESLWILTGIVSALAFVVGLCLGIALSPWYYFLILVVPLVFFTTVLYSRHNYKCAVLRTANEIMDEGINKTGKRGGNLSVELKNCNDLTRQEICDALATDVKVSASPLDEMDDRWTLKFTITSEHVRQFQKKKKAAVREGLNCSENYIPTVLSDIVSEF